MASPLLSSPLASAPSPIIAFENVSFWYDPAKKILENFNWSVRRGESWSILGPSGCGKSTLLYLIAGLRQPCTGRVLLHGQEITGPSREIGLMLQDYGLLNWYTAERNIELGLQIRDIPSHERKVRLEHWLDLLSIAHIRDQYPLQVSGGQRQRVALARLLALQAPIQLLDEPLSAVDELTRERLQKQFFQINHAGDASSRPTTLIVTHNIEEAVLLSDTVLLISDYYPITSFHIQTTQIAAIPARDDPAFVATCREIRQRMGG